MTDLIMTCRDMDDRMADCLEDTLTTAEQRLVEVHLAGCARCSALVRELRAISAEARSLPAIAPSRDLWAGIAERIEAPVLPLAAQRVAGRNLGHRHGRAIAIAAGLVFATAGLTYMLTVSRLSTPEQATRVAIVPADQPLATDSNRVTGPDALLPPPANAQARNAGVTAPGTAAQPAPINSRLAVNVEPGATSAAATADVLGGEIMRLRQLLSERRQELDPRTAAVLENSLRVIDEAIAQSRAALARDPASGFLNEQLNRSLDKKVELLRTAVLLPARAS